MFIKKNCPFIFSDTVKITSFIYHNIRTLYEHEILKKKRSHEFAAKT